MYVYRIDTYNICFVLFNNAYLFSNDSREKQIHRFQNCHLDDFDRVGGNSNYHGRCAQKIISSAVKQQPTGNMATASMRAFCDARGKLNAEITIKDKEKIQHE